MHNSKLRIEFFNMEPFTKREYPPATVKTILIQWIRFLLRILFECHIFASDGLGYILFSVTKCTLTRFHWGQPQTPFPMIENAKQHNIHIIPHVLLCFLHHLPIKLRKFTVVYDSITHSTGMPKSLIKQCFTRVSAPYLSSSTWKI